MKIRVLYEVTVDGVHYVPGIVEVKGTTGLDLLREHKGNFEAVQEPAPATDAPDEAKPPKRAKA